MSTVDGDAHESKASSGENGDRADGTKRAIQTAHTSHPSSAGSDAGAGATPSPVESSVSDGRLMLSLQQILERLSEVGSEDGAVFELLQNFWHELKAAFSARSSVTHTDRYEDLA